MEPSARGDGGLANFDRYFNAVTLSNPHDFGTFSVTSGYTRHVPRTLMFKFDFGGFKLGYSPDAAFDRDALAWLDECEMIIHDVWFDETNVLVGNISNIHTPIADFAEHAGGFGEESLSVPLCGHCVRHRPGPADRGRRPLPASPAGEALPIEVTALLYEPGGAPRSACRPLQPPLRSRQ